ncbi:phosphotransferase family protein [Nocardia iowensis]|uniref:Phosphotransferase family protein n=1 Tax=Nocardia iowensis TaxID=204891 RepID=A0ABX8S0D7_NOCIO|nr:phosphotransferase family protein [Nocardia iowensis]QXN94991.1 phosphotransferase family protein [Nocardia iowensis]
MPDGTKRPAPEHIPPLLEEVIRHRLPNAGQATITGWQRAEQGFASDTYLFTVEGIDGADEPLGLVFRRPPEVPLFPDYDLRRQFVLMKRLAPTGIPVPTVRWIDTDATALGSPYLLMDRIDGGRTPSDVPPYHESGMYLEAAPKDRTTMWWGCVDTMARLHLLDPAALHLDFLRLDRFGAHPVEQAVNYLDWAVHWAAPQIPDTIERALTWLRDNRYDPEHVTLCWGDSRLSNMLYDNDYAVLGALDWEVGHLGDHESDLAWLLLTDWVSSEYLGKPRLPGTPSREETVARYEAATGWPVRRLRFNEILGAVLLSVALLRISTYLGMGDLSAVTVARLEELLGES